MERILLIPFILLLGLSGLQADPQGKEFFANTDYYDLSIQARSLINNDPNQALIEFQDIIEKCRLDEDLGGHIFTEILISYLYKESKLANFDSALHHLNLAKNLLSSSQDENLKAYLFSDYGALFLEAKMLDSAFHYLTISQILSSNNRYLKNLYSVTSRLARVYEEAGQVRVAAKLIESLLNEYPYKDKYVVNTAKLDLLRFWIDLKQFQDFNDSYKDVKNYFEQQPNKYWVRELTRLKCQYWMGLKDYDKTISLVDSVFEQEQSLNINQKLSFFQIRDHAAFLSGNKNALIRSRAEFTEAFAQLEQSKIEVYQLYLNFLVNSSNNPKQALASANEIIFNHDISVIDAITEDFIKQYLIINSNQKLDIPQPLADYLKKKNKMKEAFTLSIFNMQMIMEQDRRQDFAKEAKIQEAKFKQTITTILAISVAIILILLIFHFQRTKKLSKQKMEELMDKVVLLSGITTNQVDQLEQLKSHNMDELKALALHQSNENLDQRWLLIVLQFKT
ncbi:MAG: hypothetical protein MRY83_01400, partial [Flavobacteriales bacterium]|nr:hypothetical protein [Flavobacteriales bacterium]